MASPELLESMEQVWPRASWAGSTVVVAVSGGPDSAALLHLLHKIDSGRSRLIVAHFNHGLRGDESLEDEAFVAQLAARYSLTYATERMDGSRDLEAVGENASESRLRKLRYDFLIRVSLQHQATWLATGHSADDCIETFLLNLFRGTGPKGLASIPASRSIASSVTLIRPLLRVRRDAILHYLTQNEYDYRIDSSNTKPMYTRNRIRLELLPKLKEFFGEKSLEERILQTSDLIRESQEALESIAKQFLAEQTVEYSDTGFRINAEPCANLPWPVLREVLIRIWQKLEWPLREMSRNQWDRVRQVLEKSQVTPHPVRTHLPGSIELSIRKSVLKGARI